MRRREGTILGENDSIINYNHYVLGTKVRRTADVLETLLTFLCFFEFYIIHTYLFLNEEKELNTISA